MPTDPSAYSELKSYIVLLKALLYMDWTSSGHPGAGPIKRILGDKVTPDFESGPLMKIEIYRYK